MLLESSAFRLDIDEDRGVVRSLRPAWEPGLEFAGNPANTSYRSFADGPWLGDLTLRTWTGDGWRPEETAASADTRSVRREPDRIVVTHAAGSADPRGLASVSVRQEWALDGEAISWTIDIDNRTDAPLELGELAAAFLFNMDYEGIFAGTDDAAYRAGGELQRQWHEDRVQQHLHVSGSGSYALYQRPNGVGPVLAVLPVGQGGWEVAYQVDPRLADQWSCTFEGPYYVASHSRATRLERQWLRTRQRQTLSMNGNSSLVLAPGARHRWGFRFVLLADPGEVGAALADAGQLAVDVWPSPALPVGETVRLHLTGPVVDAVRVETGNAVARRDPDWTGLGEVYAIDLTSRGEKAVLIEYGQGRWTRVWLYATGDPAEALAARAEFIVERQMFRAPDDPFDRDGAFLPYDTDREQLYLWSEESWQTGGSDEYGVPIAMFLAERNIQAPDAAQIRAIDQYIDGFLLRTLQDPETLRVRRGMYFSPDFPSRLSHEWDERTAGDETRYNNYALLAAVYFAMFQIAEFHGGTRRAAEDYLGLAWRTAVVGYEIGVTRFAGAPAGAFQFPLLEALAGRDAEGYRRLGSWLDRFTERMLEDPYPYGSELYIDQTAHAQVWAAVSRRADAAARAAVLRVTRAMRAGYQPSWFRYGNDERGSVCCWYGTPQNSEVLLRGFELTGDPDLLRLGWGGLSSFLTTITESGAARGWFTWWPDRLGFDPRSLDTDMGLYNYLRAATAYVIDGPFGPSGHGCTVQVLDGGLDVTVRDGVGRRVWLENRGLEITAHRAVIDRIGIRGESVEVHARPIGAGPAELRVRDVARTGPARTLRVDGRPLPPAGAVLAIDGRTWPLTFRIGAGQP